MSELYSQETNPADGYDSADAGSDTERPSRPAGENSKDSWAEDAEPLTRGEYAEQVRQELAAGQHDTTADRDQGHDQSYDQADAGDGQEQEDLPEPRTRQEVADEARNPDAAATHRDQTADAGPDADGAEEDQLSEARTRQEVAEEARSGTAPLTHVGEAVPQHEQDTGEWPSPEERSRLHETYVDWRNEISTTPDEGTRWEQGANVVGDKPDKSPADRSDLPPSGEELLHVEDDDEPRLERLGNKMYEEFGDIADVAEKASNRAQELFDHRPPAGHPEVRVPTQPYVAPTAEQHETPDAGNIAQLGLVLGVIGFRTYQSLRRKLTERKGG